MLKYKIDILEAMKEKGYTSYKIRKEKLIGEAKLTKIRSGEIAIYTLVFSVYYTQETSVFFVQYSICTYTYYGCIIISTRNKSTLKIQ